MMGRVPFGSSHLVHQLVLPENVVVVRYAGGTLSLASEDYEAARELADYLRQFAEMIDDFVEIHDTDDSTEKADEYTETDSE